MNKNILLALTFILFSCRSTSKLNGVFSSYEYSYAFKFSSDNRFEFQKYGALRRKYSAGKWYVDDRKKVYLVSDIQNKELPVILEYRQESQSITDSIKINISVSNIDTSHIKYLKCVVFEGNEEIKSTFCDNLNITLPRKEYVDIKFCITGSQFIPGMMFDTLSTKSNIYLGKDINAVSVKIGYDESFVFYYIFDNEPIVLRGKKIKYRNVWLRPTKKDF